MRPAGASILIVDDDARNRAVVRRWMDGHHRVHEAEDAEEALKILDAEPIDLCILDCMLPGMSGFDLCRAIKARPREDFLPIILLTALSAQADRNAGLEAGADEFLTKPVDGRELQMRIGAFLRLRGQERTIRRQVAELRRLEALREDLVSLMVHDLRNPLSGVLGFLQILQMEVRDVSQRDEICAALDAARKLQGTLDDMLEVRRLEEGSITVRLEPLSARGVALDAIGTVAGDAKSRGVAVDLHVEADVTVPLDRKLARRAVENLLANAVRYSPRGSSVHVLVRASPGGAEIDVADRGEGIPDEYKGVLFERFGPLGARRGDARRGYGLGLYLVRLVATTHGGSVSVQDREGGGTLFRLLFPRGAAA